MNKIAKVWEELDKKQGRLAKLSKTAKGRDVKLATVQDFESFEGEADQLSSDLNDLIGQLDNLQSEMSTALSDAEVLIDLNEQFKAQFELAFDQLTDQFEELGLDIEKQPIAKMHEEFNMSYEEVQNDVKRYAYEALEYFEAQIRAIIGTR